VLPPLKPSNGKHSRIPSTKAHQQTLAWRFKPEGESEIKHVVKFFPEVRFSTAKGATATLDYEKLLLSEWQTPLLFSTITRCRLDQSLGRHKLIIDYHPRRKRQTANP